MEIMTIPWGLGLYILTVCISRNLIIISSLINSTRCSQNSRSRGTEQPEGWSPLMIKCPCFCKHLIVGSDHNHSRGATQSTRDFLHFAENEVASMAAILVQEWYRDDEGFFLVFLFVFATKKKEILCDKESLFVLNHLFYIFSKYMCIYNI